MHPSFLPCLPQIKALCETHGVAHLELFGSATGDDFQAETSDFDFLVELAPEKQGSQAKRWIALAEDLEQLLGRHVDLVNPRYIRNPWFLQSVNATRTVIYDRQSTQVTG